MFSYLLKVHSKVITFFKFITYIIVHLNVNFVCKFNISCLILARDHYFFAYLLIFIQKLFINDEHLLFIYRMQHKCYVFQFPFNSLAGLSMYMDYGTINIQHPNNLKL